MRAAGSFTRPAVSAPVCRRRCWLVRSRRAAEVALTFSSAVSGSTHATAPRSVERSWRYGRRGVRQGDRFRLHPLKGDRAGQWGVRVSGNWRVVFRFEDGEAVAVDLIDYH